MGSYYSKNYVDIPVQNCRGLKTLETLRFKEGENYFIMDKNGDKIILGGTIIYPRVVRKYINGKCIVLGNLKNDIFDYDISECWETIIPLKMDSKYLQF